MRTGKRAGIRFGLAVSFAFPLAGLTLLAVLAADVLVLSREPFLKRVPS